MITQQPADIRKKQSEDVATKQPNQQKKDAPQIDAKEQHLICVDPDSHQVYTLNPKTNDFWIETDVTSEYRKKAEKTIRNIQKIVNLNSGNWLCESELADKYHRRKFPEYLLQMPTIKYPQYICLSPLSDAFKGNLYIKMIVDVSKYIKLEDSIHQQSIMRFKEQQKKKTREQDKIHKYRKKESKGEEKSEAMKKYEQIRTQRKIKIVEYLTGLSFNKYTKFKQKENEKLKKNEKVEIKKVGIALYIAILTAADEVLKLIFRAVYQLTGVILKAKKRKKKAKSKLAKSKPQNVEIDDDSDDSDDSDGEEDPIDDDEEDNEVEEDGAIENEEDNKKNQDGPDKKKSNGQQDPENKFMLQFFGYREYLYGPQPLSNYLRVRHNLRGSAKVNIKLIDVPSDQGYTKLFPPIIERSSKLVQQYINQFQIHMSLSKVPHQKKDPTQLPQSQIQQSQQQQQGEQQSSGQDQSLIQKQEDTLPKQIKDGQAKRTKIELEPVEWSKYQKIPCLLWYPPKRLPKYDPRQDQAIYKTFNTARQREQHIIKYFKGRQAVSEAEKELQFRALIKAKMQQFIQLKRQQYKAQIFSVENSNIYSGEINTSFRIKILGISNLLRLLQSSSVNIPDAQRATFNGILPPIYITKMGEYRRAKDAGEKVDRPKHREGRLGHVFRLVQLLEERKNKVSFMTVYKSYQNASQFKTKYSTQQSQILDKSQQSNGQGQKGQGQGQGGQGQGGLSSDFQSGKLSQDKDKEVLKLLSRQLIQEHGVLGSELFALLAQEYDIDITPYLINVQIKLFIGNQQIGSEMYTKKVPFCYNPKFNEWITWPELPICNLPLELRIQFNIIVFSSLGSESQVIATTSMNLFNYEGSFMQGQSTLNLWPFYIGNERLSCQGQYYGIQQPFQEKYLDRISDKKLSYQKSLQSSNSKPKNSNVGLNIQKAVYNNHDPLFSRFVPNEFTQLFIQTDTFTNNVLWTLKDSQIHMYLGYNETVNTDFNEKPNFDQIAVLQNLLNKDPLSRDFTREQKKVLLQCRQHFSNFESSLEVFLSAIDWDNPDTTKFMYEMLQKMQKPSPEKALALLDASFADDYVKLYAVQQISLMNDDELSLYMLELIQCLIYDTQHYSPLQEMLLERSLKNPYVVGHELFWGLRSQLHKKVTFERFALLLEQQLMLSGFYRKQLLKEIEVNDELIKIARSIKNMNVDGPEPIKMKIAEEQKLLQDLQVRKSKLFKQKLFIFALDNRCIGKDFNIIKCKCMNSKKLPLWLIMNNSQPDGDNIQVIFKDGDDIRQDNLTLQLIQIMDKIWLDLGEDFRMNPYKVQSTQDMVGMIEAVRNSATTAKIHVQYGGTYGAMKKNTIDQYLNDVCRDNINVAKENFIRSCAGYCVATYVLGIGDRHSDNIMLTDTGNLFHIDFGHFLGHFKSKFGIKRERAPFVFTQEMAFVMGGQTDKRFIEFENLCCRAYNSIRKHGHFLINIFKLMLSAGIPELLNELDIKYLADQLALDLSEQEATSKFKEEIKKSLNATSRQIDNLIHEMKRK